MRLLGTFVTKRISFVDSYDSIVTIASQQSILQAFDDESPATSLLLPICHVDCDCTSSQRYNFGV